MKKKSAVPIPEDPYTEYPNPRKRSFKSFLPILYCIGGVLAALLIVIEFFGTYDKALDNYFSVYAGGKYLRIGRLAPPEYWESLEKQYGITVEEVRDSYKKHWDEHQKELEKLVGKKPRYTYQIKKEHKLSDAVMKKLETALSAYGIEKESIKRAYKVDLTVTYSGKKDSVTRENSGYVVQIRTNWYLYWFTGDSAQFPVPLADLEENKAIQSGTSQDEYTEQFLPVSIS